MSDTNLFLLCTTLFTFGVLGLCNLASLMIFFFFLIVKVPLYILIPFFTQYDEFSFQLAA